MASFPQFDVFKNNLLLVLQMNVLHSIIWAAGTNSALLPKNQEQCEN